MIKPISPRSLFELTKGGGRLLGLDVGTKYIGVAYSEPGNRTAWPQTVLERSVDDEKKNMSEMALDFEDLFAYHSVVGMVVGHPYYGRALNYHSPIRPFLDKLYKQGQFTKPFTFWDECYTSKIYAQLLKPVTLDPSEAKTISDKLAATAILQGYLDCMNRKKPLGPCNISPNRN